MISSPMEKGTEGIKNDQLTNRAKNIPSVPFLLIEDVFVGPLGKVVTVHGGLEESTGMHAC